MLGEQLKIARDKAGLTQEELAHRADVSRQYVSLLELDKKSPTVELLIRLCAAMGVSAGEIIGRVEKNVKD
jgi:transcriptional regulator with XRE-family HTH domain